jgi:hypothetical protein
VFLELAEQTSLEQTKTFNTLKPMIWRKYSCQKLSQFSQGNNVLDASASNLDGFPWRDTCVSSTLLNRPIWNKFSLCHHENYIVQEVFFQKLPQFSQGDNVIDAAATNIDGFHRRDIRVFELK